MSKYAEKLGPIQIGIRKDIVFNRQELAGKPRYVVHDPVTFQNHAFSVLEYRILTAITPARTLAESFDVLVEQGVLSASNTDAYYTFVLSLHQKHLLQLPISQPETLFKRWSQKQAAKRAGWYRAVSNFKIPLWNPDRFLQRTEPWFGWIFSRAGVMLWALLMGVVVWKCLGRFGEMFAETAGLLALSNLPVMWIALVVLKVIHEFGHAFACKRLGGEVPEMGLIFIIMTPCAYVDASASWKFSSRWQRIGVAMGGMYVESIVAAVFALVWAGTAPGLLHDIALNVIVLASVVTVLFNLNPLMRFDGYYVFSDLCGVVNLRQRADTMLKSWCKRVLLGLSAPAARHSSWERVVYGGYAPCSFVYKITLAFGITSAVMMEWKVAGAVLGALFTWMMIVQPFLGVFRYLLTSEETEPVRRRAYAIAAAGIVAVPLTIATLPVSNSVVGSGVLQARSVTTVRAPADAFLSELLPATGDRVGKGQVVCRFTNPAIRLERIQLAGELAAEKVRFETVELSDPSLAATHRARVDYLRSRVGELDARLRSLSVTAESTGTLLANDGIGVEGNFLQRGEEVCRLQSDRCLVRVVLDSEAQARMRIRVGSIAELRWTTKAGREVTAVIREIRRSASRTDVPDELTISAGGDVYARPDADGMARADQPYLHVFLEPDWIPADGGWSGLTARVRFDARVETLGGWIRRRLLGFYNAWRMS